MPQGMFDGMGVGSGPPPSPQAPQAPAQQGGFAARADEDSMSEIVKMLRGGQVGAERFVELLTILTASTLGEQQGGANQPAPTGDPNSISGLLGG